MISLAGRGQVLASLVVLSIAVGGCSDHEPAPSRAEPAAAPPSIEEISAPPAAAMRTASGVATVVLRKGSGTQRPRPSDLVTVHYVGWTASGQVFDSSVQRGAPDTLPLGSAPRAWREGVADMTVGEKRRLWIPASLGVPGKAGQPPSAVVYDVELLAIAAQPVAPLDLAAPPADATTTSTGLAYKRLVEGTGKVHPTDANLLVVHYTGWTASGELIESSVAHGRPAERALAAMMPGWAEALRLMVEGDKVRLWIPAPRGLVVYELELVAIK